jgi:hypothetical protein
MLSEIFLLASPIIPPSEATIHRMKSGVEFMRVCELLDILARADPDDIVLFDASSDSLLFLSIQPGMHQLLDDLTASTVEEEEFLRAMHIKW